MVNKYKLRARFTRWLVRTRDEPKQYDPLWLKIACRFLFSWTLFEWLILHPVWLEIEKTDPVIWLYEFATGGDTKCAKHGKSWD